MNTIKGPAIFLAQFADDISPFNNLKNICQWAAGLGYKAVQIPAWDGRLIDIEKAGESRTYAEEIKGTVNEAGLELSEFATHLQGQLVAVHPAYDIMFDAFAPSEVHGNPKARTEWASNQVKSTLKASEHLGIKVMASFSGALLWHTVYPWPQRPAGLVQTGFAELAKRWLPILDFARDCGVEICYELHPGEDLHDGITVEKFLEATNSHPSAKILYDPAYSHVSCQRR